MPDNPKPDLTAYIPMIKHELAKHCIKLMERMDSCHEIEKSDLTKHADEESERLQSVSKDLEEIMLDAFAEQLADAMKEIARKADMEIERIKSASEYVMSNMESDAINNEDWKENGIENDLELNQKFISLLGLSFTERDIVELVKFCLLRLKR